MHKTNLKIQFTLLLSALLGFNVYSQKPEDVKSRVSEIKKWYTEIQSIGLINCKTFEYIEKDSYMADSDPMEFTQIVNTCRLNETFTIRQGKFSGYEWSQEINLYLRQGKIFFVFVTGSAEGYSYERRYYCDSNEILIQELLRESDGGQEIIGSNIDVKENLRKRITEVIDMTKFK